MNRRTFLRTGLGCAMLTATPLSLHAADSVTPKTRIPIGFLGATYSHGPDRSNWS
jgi:hypothetical protein